MKTLYFIGEPVIDVDIDDPDHVIAGPIGQHAQCEEVFKKYPTSCAAMRAMRTEYASIIEALQSMSILFKMMLSHIDAYDLPTASECITRLGVSYAKMDSSIPAVFTTYPRDMTTVIPGLTLLNDRGRTEAHAPLGIQNVIESPFGEGGRVLCSRKIMIVPEYSLVNGIRSRPTTENEVAPILKAGMRVGTFPIFIAGELKSSGAMKHFFNDHLDRISTLIDGKDGKTHLIIDSGALIARDGHAPGDLGAHIPADEIAQLIAGEYQQLGIRIHIAPPCKIPYALNLEQFEDGRVLMTGGAPELTELIESIIGSRMVTTTSVPIECFPTFKFAGIRCMIAKAPLDFLTKAAQ